MRPRESFTRLAKQVPDADARRSTLHSLELLHQDSVAHAIAALGAVIAAGLALGHVQIFGVSLGVAGVPFAGVVAAHFGLRVNAAVLEFTRELGLVFFVFTIGLQLGPGLFASLRRQGLALNVMAATVVLLGTGLALLAIRRLFRIDLETEKHALRAARAIWKLNYIRLCGLLAGSMTDPAGPRVRRLPRGQRGYRDRLRHRLPAHDAPAGVRRAVDDSISARLRWCSLRPGCFT